MDLSVLDSKTRTIFDALLRVDPSQEDFVGRRLAGFDDRAWEATELAALSSSILALVGDELERFIGDYLWLCQEQIGEELFFRRNGRYRLTTFAEAEEQVYSNKPYMTRYMDALLLTQVFWANHTQTFHFYRNAYLNSLPKGFTHLEVGPGHGLFLHEAASHEHCQSCVGWDISESSIGLTKECLEHLGGVEKVDLQLCDMFAAEDGSFDSIVFSEVLEHMEEPEKALSVLVRNLSPTGKLFINMPINSPAPDHLFNCPTPAAFSEFITSCGLRILESQFAPATGYSLAEAEERQLTINCAMITTAES